MIGSTLPDEFWVQVEVGDCWAWTGYTNPKGYGVWSTGRERRAHRLVWLDLVGEIGKRTLDHLCRNRRCVNTDHLQPATVKVNVLRGYGITAMNARKTHCTRGHQRWGVSAAGTRYCMDCQAMHARAAYWRSRQ